MLYQIILGLYSILLLEVYTYIGISCVQRGISRIFQGLTQTTYLEASHFDTRSIYLILSIYLSIQAQKTLDVSPRIDADSFDQLSRAHARSRRLADRQ